MTAPLPAPASPVYLVGSARAALWNDGGGGKPDMLGAWRPSPNPRTDLPRGKAIIICCDGTGNSPSATSTENSTATNVYRLYEALTEDTQFGTRQVTWYDPGVGTGTSRAATRTGFFLRIARKIVNILPDWLTENVDRILKALEGATGVWIEENIEQGYREIVRNYEPGDRIYIFGFSRGAYTARCIAGVIDRCGLLKSENIRHSTDVITIYRRRKSKATPPIIDSELIHDRNAVRVHVLGLWDTVASLGLPLWGWWFRIGAFWRNKNLDSNPAGVCDYVYHALSMDEQRSQFFPTITTPGPGNAQTRLRQVWFRGAHADVGGGYPNRSLASISFEWMLQIAHHHGLRVRKDVAKVGDLPQIAFHPINAAPICPKADPMGKIHDEIKSNPGWVIFGSWPRWAPVPRPGWLDRFQRDATDLYGAPHDLVYRRAERAARLWRARPAAHPKPDQPQAIDGPLARDGLIFIGIGKTMRIKVSAQSVWNRTGLVFESGAIYKIAYVDGRWRDAEKDLCRAAGQSPSGFDAVRRVLGYTKRVRSAPWMQLIGHVGHPRSWPVAEFGLRILLKLIFLRDPAPLTKSLISMGEHMSSQNASVYVVTLAPNGIFYAFANDAWQTYANNSRAIELDVTRVSEIPPNSQLYAVTPRGEIVESKGIPDELLEHLMTRNRILKPLAETGAACWPDLTATDQAPSEEIHAPAEIFADDAIAFMDTASKPPNAAPELSNAVSAELQAVDHRIYALLASLSELANKLEVLGKKAPPADFMERMPKFARQPATRREIRDAILPWATTWPLTEIDPAQVRLPEDLPSEPAAGTVATT